MENRVRISDIAEELGLSTATVSNVIHGKTKKISDETVKRVEQLLEKRQYVPSMAGILLAQNSSKIIGVVINDHEKYENRALEDPFISGSLSCLLSELNKKGYFMMVKCTPDLEEIVRLGSMWNMDGMVIIGFCKEDYEHLRNQMHIPFVIYDGFCMQKGKYVNLSLDDFDGGYQMGQYLISMGHRNICFLADNDICMDRERYLGLQEAAKTHENKADSVLVDRILIPMTWKERISFYKENKNRLLEYSALFLASDAYAIECMNCLMDEGIEIPNQLSVVGFDGIPAAKSVRPRLTTISQDGEYRAHMAIEMLEKLKKEDLELSEVKVPVHLEIGNSVKNINIK